MGNSLEEKLSQVTQERDLYWKLLELGIQTDLQRLIEEALSLIVGVTHAKKGFLAIFGGGGIEAPRFSIARSCSAQEIEVIKYRISRGIVEQTLSTNQTVLTPSACLEK